MRWAEPYAIHGAGVIAESDLKRSVDAYQARLRLVIEDARRARTAAA
jgi:hypothetical protein